MRIIQIIKTLYSLGTGGQWLAILFPTNHFCTDPVAPVRVDAPCSSFSTGGGVYTCTGYGLFKTIDVNAQFANNLKSAIMQRGTGHRVGIGIERALVTN